SGGLDSTLVVSRAERIERLPTFTVAYRDGDLDDVQFARRVSEGLSAPHHEELLELGDLTSALRRAARTFDEPLYDDPALAMLELSRLTRTSVKVALSGDGGDEVFGGYGWHETALRYERLRKRLRIAQPLLSAAERGVIAPLSKSSVGRRVSGAARLLGREFVDRYFPVRGFFDAGEQRRLLGKSPADAAGPFPQFHPPEP